MKYSKKIIIGLALCAGIVTSCKEDEAGVSNNISTDKDEITIGPEGGTEQIAVSTNADWVAGSAKPWISISPANGMGSADCRLAIDSTLENNARTTQIRFAAEGQEPKLITITQFGFNKQILLKEPEVEIENSAEYDKRFFDDLPHSLSRQSYHILRYMLLSRHLKPVLLSLREPDRQQEQLSRGQILPEQLQPESLLPDRQELQPIPVVLPFHKPSCKHFR